MADVFVCKNQARRLTLQRLTGPGAINGIDFLEVIDDQSSGLPRQQILAVTMFRGLTPGQIKPANIAITGSATTPVAVSWAYTATEILNAPNANSLPGMLPAELPLLKALFAPLAALSPPTSPPTARTDAVLVVRTDRPGDFSPYRLSLVASPTNTAAPPNIDTQLRFVDFTFKARCPTDIDCLPTPCAEPEVPIAPELDYLTKDYPGFRQLMLDRVAIVAPQLDTTSAADLSVVILELLAHAADKISYLQDAVATEAYLGTARLRRSVRRHARLLDYLIGEGSNARTFIRFTIDPTFPGLSPQIPKGYMLLTTAVDGPKAITSAADLDKALAAGTPVFETMETLDHASSKQNQILFYTWGDDGCCLPTGATRATLDNTGNALTPANFQVGDLIALAEVLGPDSGLPEDADPAHRQVVRLTSATFTQDVLFVEPGSSPPVPQRVVEIEWSAEDALTFPLCLSRISPGAPQPVSVVWGNIALADHGHTVVDPTLTVEGDPFRPTLAQGPLVWQGRVNDAKGQKVLFDPNASAASVFGWLPSEVIPAIILLNVEEGIQWEVRRDLLESDGLSEDFVVETEDDGSVELRFGDGTLGREPSGHFTATYRIGDPIEGNVGADMIQRFVVSSLLPINAVTNPVPAHGGTAPETLDHVRINAPQAFRTQLRAVTEADYAAAAETHPDVQRAHAARRFTGSWFTIFIAIDRKGGRPVDASFAAEIGAIIEAFRMAGHDFVIEAARFVPLEIVLPICVKSGFLPGEVRVRLNEAFSAGTLPNGKLGFFHPDNFTFGQPLYLSQVLATASAVQGVASIDTSTDAFGNSAVIFHRTDQPKKNTTDPTFDVIRVDAGEVIRVDNDINQPQHGKITFALQGGA